MADIWRILGPVGRTLGRTPGDRVSFIAAVWRRPTTHPPWEGPSDHHPGGGAAPSTLDVWNPGHLGLSVGLSYGISMEDVQVRMYDSRGTRRAIYCDRARSAREKHLRYLAPSDDPVSSCPTTHPPSWLAVRPPRPGGPERPPSDHPRRTASPPAFGYQVPQRKGHTVLCGTRVASRS